MVARSRPTLRRSSRRNNQTPSAALVTETPEPSTLTLSHPPKRNRIPSVSEAETLKKRRKIEHYEYSPKYKFPLRSRPNNEPLQSLPLKIGTNPVTSVQKVDASTPCTRRQNHSSQNAAQKLHQQQPQQQCQSQSTDKRTLRSQDGGSRSKSELSLYFTNYEQMLTLEPAKPDILTAKTHITLIDDLPLPVKRSSSPPNSAYTSTHKDPDPFGAQKPLYNAHRIDLNSAIQGPLLRQFGKDTLPEDAFRKAHRKAERHEKQLRNIEKERAQHEKVQLDRLLEELKGPDWLKVMGISGITESEKKLYEPKRVFFIREVAGLIEKFRHWKEEEKRRKMEREQLLLAEEEEGEGGNHCGQDGIQASSQLPTSESVPGPSIPPAAPETHDVDAAAALQLHQEAISASPPSGKTAPKRRLPNTNLITSASYSSLASPPTRLNHEPGSFFAKRHMRDAAIAGHRRGRNKLAFGELVPDPEEREFELPGKILTRDMIRARARLRRRLRRGSPESGH